MAHSTQLTPKSLNRINQSTIPLFISHFHQCWLRFSQTKATSEYCELQLKHCQIKASISRQLQAQALNLSSRVKHVVIWKIVYAEFSEVGETFCFQAKAQDSIHIDIEQLLVSTHWKF